MYNNENIFAKIIRKEIPARVVFESETVLAFYDINPKSKIHVLVIPKASYTDFHSFMQGASHNDIAAYFQAVHYIANDVLKLPHYRLITNNGHDSGQEVFHFHTHILG